MYTNILCTPKMGLCLSDLLSWGNGLAGLDSFHFSTQAGFSGSRVGQTWLALGSNTDVEGDLKQAGVMFMYMI